MQYLRAILSGLPDDTQLSNGAVTATPEFWRDNCSEAELETQVVLRYDRTALLHVCKLDERGYIIEPALFVEVLD